MRSSMMYKMWEILRETKRERESERKSEMIETPPFISEILQLFIENVKLRHDDLDLGTHCAGWNSVSAVF